MGRIELTLLIAGTIVLAVLAGWVLRVFYVRMARAGTGNAGSNELAAQLQAAEAERNEAIKERDMSVRELRNKLGQTEAELSAAMDGLGNARREVEELRAEMERMRG